MDCFPSRLEIEHILVVSRQVLPVGHAINILKLYRYQDVTPCQAVKQFVHQEVQFARAPGGHLSDAVDFPYCMLEAIFGIFQGLGKLRTAQENCQVFSEIPFSRALHGFL